MVSHSALAPTDSLDALFCAGREALAEQRRLHARLAARLIPGGPDEEALLALIAGRPALQSRIGAAVLRYLADEEEPAAPAGGLPEPGSEPAAVEPEPEPAAAEREPEPKPTAAEDAPPSAPEVPARPSAPPATAAALAELSIGPRWGAQAPTLRPPDPDIVPTLAARLQAALERPADQLVRVCVEVAEEIEESGVQGPELHALLGAWAALARAAQDELRPGDRALDPSFRAMARVSKDRRPGVVHGLGREHRPRGRSWRADAASELVRLGRPPATESPERALAQLDTVLRQEPPAPDAAVQVAVRRVFVAGVAATDPRLVRLVGPRVDALRVGKEWSTLRKAVRAAAASATPAPMKLADADTDLDAAWPGFRHTDGKRVAMVGGDLREERRERLAQAFRVASLDWVSGSQPRQVQALAERVRNGSVDLVWVLTAFCGHSAGNLVGHAADAAGVPWVNVRSGYGVQNIRIALEGLR